MMIHAYSEFYLNDAKQNLAEFFDYAINTCCFEANFFSKLFVQSGYADKFERGNPAIVAGISGIIMLIQTGNFQREYFQRIAQTCIGLDGHWPNINGQHANDLKIFFQEFHLRKSSRCTAYITKWILNTSLKI